jgi:multidrug efflux system membrane fusion protein
MLSGDISSQPVPETAGGEPPPLELKLETRRSAAESVALEHTLRAQLEPLRSVTLRAETDGPVVELPVAKGQRVAAGQLLVGLGLKARETERVEAEALVRQREVEAEATRSLVADGVQPPTLARQKEAELAAALAQLARIEQEIADTRVASPFAGVLNDRHVELGDFVDRGEPLATVVDDSSVLVTAQVPQQLVGSLRPGLPARARLASGELVSGRIRYLSAVGDAATRSFRIEVAVPNPQQRLVLGSSVDLLLSVGEVRAHKLPAALLTVTTDGQMAVPVVESGQNIKLHPVTIVRAEGDGVWVSGLPETVELVVAGQGFVTPGQQPEHPAAPDASEQQSEAQARRAS